MAVAGAPAPIGELLRSWRQRRSRSRLELALNAAVSSRHLSFLETGRARPSREMVLHLADELEVPLRERNALPLAAGFAPLYTERSLEAPEMASVRRCRCDYATARGELAFFSTLSTFGTAVDITRSELSIEAFYPANAHTALKLLRQIDPGAPG